MPGCLFYLSMAAKIVLCPPGCRKKMYEEYTGGKELFIAPAADHATSYFFHTLEYEQAVRNFLLRHLPELC